MSFAFVNHRINPIVEKLLRSRTLGPAVVTCRVAHASIALGFLSSIAYVWWCAISYRRGPLLRLAVTALLAEGLVVTANHGDCPLGPLGDRIGDGVPLFELVVSPRAARLAVPALGVVAAAGISLLGVRSVLGENAARQRKRVPQST